MISNYLNIVIFAVCFYDAVLSLLLPSSANVILGTDGSAGRMVTYLLSMGLFSWVFLQYGFKKILNPWVLVLFVFMIFSSFHGPNIHIESLFVPKDQGLFNFKPLFESANYLCLFMAMANIPLTKDQYKKIVRAFVWVGIISSAYIVIQYLGLDQIYRLTDEMPLSQMTRHPHIGGLMSQPVFAGALLVMCIPFFFAYRLSWVLLAVVAMFLTGNRSCLIALFCISFYLIPFQGGRQVVYKAIASYIGLLVLVTALYWSHPQWVQWFDATGRLGAWKMMIADFFHPNFPGVSNHGLTGFGLGSFSTLFPFYNHSGFYQAHNELLEVFYTLSFVGLYFFIRMLWHVIKSAHNVQIFLSLSAILVCALTNAVWHIAQLQFLTVFLAGLAYNPIGEVNANVEK